MTDCNQITFNQVAWRLRQVYHATHHSKLECYGVPSIGLIKHAKMTWEHMIEYSNTEQIRQRTLSRRGGNYTLKGDRRARLEAFISNLSAIQEYEDIYALDEAGVPKWHNNQYAKEIVETRFEKEPPKSYLDAIKEYTQQSRRAIKEHDSLFFQDVAKALEIMKERDRMILDAPLPEDNLSQALLIAYIRLQHDWYGDLSLPYLVSKQAIIDYLPESYNTKERKEINRKFRTLGMDKLPE